MPPSPLWTPDFHTFSLVPADLRSCWCGHIYQASNTVPCNVCECVLMNEAIKLSGAADLGSSLPATPFTMTCDCFHFVICKCAVFV